MTKNQKISRWPARHLPQVGKSWWCASLFVALQVSASAGLAQEATPSAATKSTPSVQATQVFTLYEQGDYSATAELGGALLTTEASNLDLRYAVANSYAWTGKLTEAITHYQALNGTRLADKANLGLANAYRWDGQYGLAEARYVKVLDAEPGNKDAVEGMTYLTRELRPRTQVRAIWASDSSNTFRTGTILAQRWTDLSRQYRLNVELGELQDKRNDVKVNQRDVTFLYSSIVQPLRPSVEISVQDEPRNTLFWSGSIHVPDRPVTIDGGHINWGKLAFDPTALQAHLWANHIGIQASPRHDLGLWNISYAAARVADTNVIQDASLKLTPTWQPFTIQELKLFAGFEGRKALFNSPSYWSPVDGSYLGTLGFTAEWQNIDWDRNILLQYGVPLGGEAQQSYNANVGFKRWIGTTWAIGFNAAVQKSQRSGSYRASSAWISVEGLW